MCVPIYVCGHRSAPFCPSDLLLYCIHDGTKAGEPRSHSLFVGRAKPLTFIFQVSCRQSTLEILFRVCTSCSTTVLLLLASRNAVTRKPVTVFAYCTQLSVRLPAWLDL